MKISLEVENIRCGGCANTITKKIQTLAGVKTVDVAIDEQIVSVEGEDGIDTAALKETLAKTLLGLGYPEKGSVEGIEALKGKAKSVVSCAIGKVS